jgi:hypothetical protein
MPFEPPSRSGADPSAGPRSPYGHLVDRVHLLPEVMKALSRRLPERDISDVVVVSGVHH